jgi:hypothetical protein
MSGATIGAIRIVLRLEGLCVLIAASVAYSKFGLGWGTFALFFFTPDVSFLGYLAGPKVGAITYNLAHSYIGAIACLVVGFLLPAPTIWRGHYMVRPYWFRPCSRLWTQVFRRFWFHSPGSDRSVFRGCGQPGSQYGHCAIKPRSLLLLRWVTKGVCFEGSRKLQFH